ncbi:MAG TPA: hypothetical protein VKJ45_07360, partial [Blastocatellia bacterium]|nr:hypothetical protein [Blastocatellia bacterium]
AGALGGVPRDVPRPDCAWIMATATFHTSERQDWRTTTRSPESRFYAGEALTFPAEPVGKARQNREQYLYQPERAPQIIVSTDNRDIKRDAILRCAAQCKGS